MKRENHLDFMTNRKNKYSIRKFSVGAASILVGSLIFLSPQVGAEENDTEEASVEEGAEEAAAEQTEEPAAEESTEEASAEESTEEASAEESTEEASAEESTEEAAADQTEEPVAEESTEEESVEESTEEAAADQTEEPVAEESTEEESVEAAQQADTTPPEILDVKVYEEMSDSGVDGEIPLITVEVTASDESEVPEVAAIFQEVGNPGNRQSTSLPTVEVNENGDYVVTASIVTEGEGTTYELIELKVADIHGNVTETTEYNQEVTTGEDTEEPPEEEPDDGDQPGDGDESDGGQNDDGQDGDDSGDGQDDEDTDDEETPDSEEPPLSESSYFSANLSGYEGDGYLTIDGSAPENTVVTLTMPDGSVEEVTVDESGSFSVEIDEHPVGSEVNVHFLFEDDSEFEDDLEIKYLGDEDEDDSEDDQDGDEGSDDGQEDGDDTDDGQEDGDDTDEGQEGDGSEDDQDDSGDSDDGQDDEDTDDEETPDSEEPPLSESSYFSANLSGYEGDGYLTIDGSAPANTVVTLTMPDGSVEEVTVDESGSFSVEIDEYPVGSEVNVHFLFEDDSEFEDDLEIKYLGDEDEDDSEDDQDGDEGSDDGQEDGDDTDEGQDDGEESVEDQDGDDSEELDEDEITYSYLEDYGTGIMVHSNSAELLNLTLSVEVLSPSALIEEPHDLYDIEILDEDGNEYDLSNPVTVSIPADGSVANVYHLGENGETVESVPYSVEDGYVVFEVSDFSQYAVAYNEGVVAESEDDGTSAVSEDAGDDTTEGQVDAADGDGAVTPVDQDAGDGNEVSGDEAEELPDTGVAENGLLYSIATLLGALGLGSLVFSRRRRN